ncbi:hypothetical protein [Zoogloea sp.]|uniref:hypothetical protein n=1 Tax=Zoogloea sp. TaxID=49181 RepID=UPI0026150BA3|nr:hypothetical protein [Zoogloea sp.]MDD3355284.1 hypothetical protein [Zoogloea sp.]
MELPKTGLESLDLLQEGRVKLRHVEGGDVDELARAGLVTVSEKVLPGHGRMKEVRATAQRISLMAEVA